MSAKTILTLGIDPARFKSLSAERCTQAEIVQLNDVDAIMDVLWIKGDEVAAIVVPTSYHGDGDLRLLVDTVQTDWPMIELLTA